MADHVARPDVDGACHYALRRLARELPPDLRYHSLQHTRDDVLPNVRRLAAREGIRGEGLQLLCTAAAYHDLGFVEHYMDHEAISIRLAVETLPRFGFSARQIRAIGRMIWATRMPQAPQNLLDQILADADLDSLGRDDYPETSGALRAELAARGLPLGDADWYRRQYSFLAGHTYFTRSQRQSREAGKQRNLEALAARLAILA